MKKQKKQVQLTRVRYCSDDDRVAVMLENVYPAPLYVDVMELYADKTLLYQLPPAQLEQVCGIVFSLTEKAYAVQLEQLRAEVRAGRHNLGGV